MLTIVFLLIPLSLSVRGAEAAKLTSTALRLMPNPNANGLNNYLSNVGILSASDIWAVGSYKNISNVYQTLTEQWNGSTWNIVSSPDVGTGDNHLYSVAAISANDIWAVDRYINNTGASETLTEQWNGSSWNIVASPNPSSSYNQLFGVAAVSANDVWAVGYYKDDNGNFPTLIEQWNGASWAVVPSPSPGGSNGLYGVAAASTSNVWAVGEYYNGATWRSLIEQWNGTQWSVIASPNVGSADYFSGVAVVSAKNSWAVGDYQNSTNVYQTLVERWNGTQWKVVKSPNALASVPISTSDGKQIHSLSPSLASGRFS